MILLTSRDFIFQCSIFAETEGLFGTAILTGTKVLYPPVSKLWYFLEKKFINMEIVIQNGRIMALAIFKIKEKVTNVTTLHQNVLQMAVYFSL